MDNPMAKVKDMIAATITSWTTGSVYGSASGVHC